MVNSKYVSNSAILFKNSPFHLYENSVKTYENFLSKGSKLSKNQPGVSSTVASILPVSYWILKETLTSTSSFFLTISMCVVGSKLTKLGQLFLGTLSAVASMFIRPSFCAIILNITVADLPAHKHTFA